MTDQLQFPCPTCDRPVHTTIRAARRSRLATCGAGHATALVDPGLQRALRDADRELKEFHHELAMVQLGLLRLGAA